MGGPTSGLPFVLDNTSPLDPSSLASSIYFFSSFHQQNQIIPPPPPGREKEEEEKEEEGWRRKKDHAMVGLSVVLEGYKDMSSKNSDHHQVISKASMMIKPSPSPSSATPPPPTPPSPFTKRNGSFNLSTGSRSRSTTGFLDYCFLCKQKLLPGKDIYMYKGDRAFCSEECRCRQIFMDEEETIKAKTDYCSLAASSSRSSSRKGTKKRANGFAY